MKITSTTQRALLLGFLASLATCGLLGIYVLLIGNMGWYESRVLGSAALFAAASILAMAAAVAWESRRWPPLGLLGMIAPAVSLVITLVVIWRSGPNTPEFWLERLMGASIVVAIALPHVCLLSMARLHRGYEWVRRGTVIVIAMLSVLIIWMIFGDPLTPDLVIRVIGTLTILNACGTIAVPILHRISGIRERSAIVTTQLQLSLTCPRCGKTGEFATGHSRCTCGLRFRIEIEEEHCARCGYALYGITSGVCPECGAAVTASGAVETKKSSGA